MRKYAVLEEPVDNIKKIMLYDCAEGVYLFLYDCVDDVHSVADYYFASIEEAEEACVEDFGIVNQDSWIIIDDPLEHCQHDIIAPVRIRGRELGDPQWNHYEILVDGEWVEFKFE